MTTDDVLVLALDTTLKETTMHIARTVKGNYISQPEDTKLLKEAKATDVLLVCSTGAIINETTNQLIMKKSNDLEEILLDEFKSDLNKNVFKKSKLVTYVTIPNTALPITTKMTIQQNELAKNETFIKDEKMLIALGTQAYITRPVLVRIFSIDKWMAEKFIQEWVKAGLVKQYASYWRLTKMCRDMMRLRTGKSITEMREQQASEKFVQEQEKPKAKSEMEIMHEEIANAQLRNEIEVKEFTPRKLTKQQKKEAAQEEKYWDRATKFMKKHPDVAMIGGESHKEIIELIKKHGEEKMKKMIENIKKQTEPKKK